MDRTDASCRANTVYVKKGCSPDNAACEGFFGRLKNEMFYGRSWIGVTMDDFINELNSYINWYNTKRIKKSLGYMSPVEYRHSLVLFYADNQICPYFYLLLYLIISVHNKFSYFLTSDTHPD